MAKYELGLAFKVKTIVWEGNLLSLWLHLTKVYLVSISVDYNSVEKWF